MHVKPVSGRQVPDPDKGGFLPPEGREVEATAYWLRRLTDGDVTEATNPLSNSLPQAGESAKEKGNLKSSKGAEA